MSARTASTRLGHGGATRPPAIAAGTDSLRRLGPALRVVLPCVGRSREAGDVLTPDWLPDEPLDRDKLAALLRRGQRDRVTALTGSGGAPDAVHVVLGNVREIEVDNVTDANDVEPAGGDVGRDEGVDLTRAEAGERPVRCV